MAARPFGVAIHQDDSERAIDEVKPSGGDDHKPDGEAQPISRDESANPPTGGGIINPAELPRAPGRLKSTSAERGRLHRAKQKAKRSAANSGAPKAPKPKPTTQTTGDIAALLYTGHVLLASFFREPGIAVTEEEAEKYAKAFVRVGQCYDLAILDEKTAAWLGLGMVFCEVHGTRIAAAFIDRKRRGPQVVTPMKQATYSPPHQPITMNEAIAEGRTNG